MATSSEASVLLSDMPLGVGGRHRADHVPGPEVDRRNPRRQRQVHTPPRASAPHCRRAHIFTEPVERCRGVKLAEIRRPTSICIGVIPSPRPSTFVSGAHLLTLKIPAQNARAVGPNPVGRLVLARARRHPHRASRFGKRPIAV